MTIMIIISYMTYSSYYGAISVNKVEFDNNNDCISAAKLIKENASKKYSNDIFCVPRGKNNGRRTK